VTIEGPRILDKALNYGLITNLDPEYPTVGSVDGDGWNTLDDNTFVSRSYFDISGYNLEQLTAFIQAVTVQEEFGIFGNLVSYVVDIVSLQSIEDDEITSAHITRPSSLGDLPGFSRSLYNMEHIIYAQNRDFINSVEWGRIAPQSITSWGTGSITAGRKLYITRIVYTDINGALNQYITLPPANFVIALVVAKQPEGQWMFNLKRTYEQEPRR